MIQVINYKEEHIMKPEETKNINQDVNEGGTGDTQPRKGLCVSEEVKVVFHQKAIHTGEAESPKKQPFLWMAEDERGAYDTSDWDKAILAKQKTEKENQQNKIKVKEEQEHDAHDEKVDEEKEVQCIEKDQSGEKAESESSHGESVDDLDDDDSHGCVKCCGKEKKKKGANVQPVSEEKAKEIIAKFKEIDFGREPLQMTCPVCMKDITTVTDDASGLLTCICCTSIFILGGCLGCFLIPLCVHRCSDVEHSCPNCETFLGLSAIL